MRTGSQSLKILAVALVLCVLWNMALGRLPKPELGETNYTANRLRIERFLDSRPDSKNAEAQELREDL